MRIKGRTPAIAPIIVAAAFLLWPAVWNGYPLVFSDTGTYLSQAIEHYVGWDRPIFYSLFLFPLHLTITTWPVIVVQALLVTHVLHLVRRTLLPQVSIWWLVPITATMAVATALPWFVSQLMPDVFTGVLVLVLALLIFAPKPSPSPCGRGLGGGERIWLVILATFMIAAHLSHLPLALALVVILAPLRRWPGAAMLQTVAPVALAMIALISVNLMAFGRASVSPFGNVFLLTRIIYDGPGIDALRRACPDAGWRLCAFLDRLPALSDDFLWRQDGPIVQAGGAKLVSAEANAIIAAALRAEPGTELRAFLNNTQAQLMQFATGDGLQPWPATVTPTIERDFSRSEATIYTASLQNHGTLEVGHTLQTLHLAIAVAGVIGCCTILLVAWRGHPTMARFAVAALLALLVNAAVTGGLSGPHDRYQSRIMWLPPFITLFGVIALPAGRLTAIR